MSPKLKRLLIDVLIACCVLAILTLLAYGQIAAVVLVMVPLTFLIFSTQNR